MFIALIAVHSNPFVATSHLQEDTHTHTHTPALEVCHLKAKLRVLKPHRHVIPAVKQNTILLSKLDWFNRLTNMHKLFISNKSDTHKMTVCQRGSVRSVNLDKKAFKCRLKHRRLTHYKYKMEKQDLQKFTSKSETSPTFFQLIRMALSINIPSSLMCLRKI